MINNNLKLPIKIKKKISTASAKAKARNLQNYIRDLILLSYPQLEPDDVKSAIMGESNEDIKLSPAARKLFPYSVEAKARAKIVIYNWYSQAETNAKDYEPLLVIKADRKKPLIVLDLEYFFKLLERLK